MEIDSSKKVVVFLFAIAVVASIATYFVLSSISDTDFVASEEVIPTDEAVGIVSVEVIDVGQGDSLGDISNAEES